MVRVNFKVILEGVPAACLSYGLTLLPSLLGFEKRFIFWLKCKCFMSL